MNLVDKLLLGLLVGLLPIGIVTATLVGNEEPSGTDSTAASIDEEKLKQVITQTVQQSQPQQQKPKQFALGSVSYASESGKLKVAGTAPVANSTIFVTAVVLPASSPPATTSPSPGSSPTPTPQVFGSNIETLSILPKSAGIFEFEYEVDKDFADSIIELRLEQNESVSTVRFDLAKKTQVL